MLGEPLEEISEDLSESDWVEEKEPLFIEVHEGRNEGKEQLLSVNAFPFVATGALRPRGRLVSNSLFSV